MPSRVGAYRDVELRRQHPLTKTLGELAREGRLEDSKSAARELEPIAERSQVPLAIVSVDVLKAFVHYTEGRFEEAERASRSGHEKYSFKYTWRSWLALALAVQNRHDEAQALFDELASGDFADIARDGTWLWTLGGAGPCMCLTRRHASQRQYLRATQILRETKFHLRQDNYL